jgi:hypothetical protein
MSGIYSGNQNANTGSWTSTTNLASYTAAGVQSVKACNAGTYATRKVGGTMTQDNKIVAVGGGTATKCEPCKAASGFYCPAAFDSEEGLECPTGYSCAGGTAAPVWVGIANSGLCPPGTYGGQPVCLQCEAGYYCKGGQEPPKKCSTLGVTGSGSTYGYFSKPGSRTCCNSCNYKLAGLPAFAVQSFDKGLASYCADTHENSCFPNMGTGSCGNYFGVPTLSCYQNPP